MKKLFFIFIVFVFQFMIFGQAKTLEDYTKYPYIGTEINKAVNGNLPFVLVIADPNDKTSIIKYFPIGKMVYQEFKNEYDFCILNAEAEENKEYIEFFKPEELPEVYVVNPLQNSFGKIDKKYHNTYDMRRILKNILTKEND